MQKDNRRPLTSLGIVELDAVRHTSMVLSRFCHHDLLSSFLKRFTLFNTVRYENLLRAYGALANAPR